MASAWIADLLKDVLAQLVVEMAAHSAQKDTTRMKDAAFPAVRPSLAAWSVDQVTSALSARASTCLLMKESASAVKRETTSSLISSQELVCAKRATT
jgi:hypothetical protein